MRNKRTVRVTGIAALLMLALVLSAIATSVYGLYLAFSASLVLGIVVLIIEPLPLLIGLVSLLSGQDVAQKIMELFQ